ncbi:MAG: GTP-binding protein, partial [Clostridia bacterium]|nr:GTP-binding protein [Clostridia bacterium]
TIDAIQRCDVAVLMIDASEGVTEQDVKIAGLIDDEGKPSIIAINKWDLVEKDTETMNDFIKKLDIDLAFMKYYKTIFISCETGQRLGQIMENVDYVYANANRKITMGLFNNVLTNATMTTPPPYRNGRRLKILYGHQAGVCPPSFEIKCNDASIVENSYMKYIENSLRKAFDFTGTPIKIYFKNERE